MIMVTAAEQDEARRWLARRGHPAGRPTPLVAVLIGTRQAFRGRGMVRYFVYVLLACGAGAGYASLFGSGGTQSWPVYFFVFAMSLSSWDTVRLRERDFQDDVAAPHPPDPWWRVLGGWYLASLVLVFGGGVALAGAIYFGTPARTYAVSWLVLLTLSAVVVGWVLIGLLRRPLLAEDTASLAVARALRAEALYAASPAMVVVPLVLDFLLHRVPPGFTPWLGAYFAAGVLLQIIGYAVHWSRHRTLPPGHYGTLPVPDPGTPVDWSPPKEA
ncbi:hypothetical protein VA596_03710 [Amycolatopsis sp., V23-08]|uniref:Uncharacterized protein n=1 Tax=Amycolatopsis heterodermiae TaxID=3110235 RepID=A0ABU5QYP1_9PSEU|nr:hypothetical protein [Amycolatopsis sp., V23-08]MEA5358630.1 hypothetical protein [Amycolatopsis sp., V23-08]